jgi:hypothetical protein
MHTYFAYGLGIHSALPLPEFQAIAGVEADVVIRYDALADHRPSTVSSSQHCFTPEAAYLRWDKVAIFRVVQGKEIVIAPFPGADKAQIRLHLSSVMAVLLHQRQYFVLHASAIAIEGNVVAFVGEKGKGKSTIAAMLYGRGHELVADDIVAVDMRDRLMVAPGFPQLNLWSDAVVSTLAQDPETLPRLDARYDKHALPVTERFCQTVLPLKRIYVLSEGTAPAIKPLELQAALKQIFTHWYLADVANQLLKGESAALHLRQCATLVRQIPVQKLERPRALSLLPQIAQLIEGDLLEAKGSSSLETIPMNNSELAS